MYNVLRKNLCSRKGFTLIEMMVVLIIIALLLSTSVPIYSTVIAKTRETTQQANLRNQNLASISYELFHQEIETLSNTSVIKLSEALPTAEKSNEEHHQNNEENQQVNEWNASYNYKIGDIVSYNRTYYRANTASRNRQPDFYTKNWHVYVL